MMLDVFRASRMSLILGTTASDRVLQMKRNSGVGGSAESGAGSGGTGLKDGRSIVWRDGPHPSWDAGRAYANGIFDLERFHVVVVKEISEPFAVQVVQGIARIANVRLANLVKFAISNASSRRGDRSEA